jgi:ribosome-binding factor A
MPEGARPSRVSEEFREILAEEIPRLKDPRVGFVTVTGVRVTPDLRRARVFYTAMGGEPERRATAAALRSARGHLRRVIGRQVRMKVLPELEFEEDETIETADRIEELLRGLHEEGSSSAAVAPDEDAAKPGPGRKKEGSSSAAVAPDDEDAAKPDPGRDRQGR